MVWFGLLLRGSWCLLLLLRNGLNRLWLWLFLVGFLLRLCADPCSFLGLLLGGLRRLTRFRRGFLLGLRLFPLICGNQLVRVPAWIGGINVVIPNYTNTGETYGASDSRTQLFSPSS